jgi:hypothetical protein
MEVRTFPNLIRPGIGMAPRQEGQRPLLPQHARHCPVLEAGSALGFLVYPALAKNESFHVEYEGEGRYRLTYFISGPTGRWEPVFSLDLTLPIGGIGMMKEQVTFATQNRPFSADDASKLARAFIVPEDMGTPPGAVALRASTNFRTPEGWDTVYAPVANVIDRPVAPMLSVRVETDWYAHSTEFRYVLQPGEGIAGAHNMPVGQVFFVPREEITLGDCTREELDAIYKSMEEFNREKAKLQQDNPLGTRHSPLYTRRSREQKGTPETS